MSYYYWFVLEHKDNTRQRITEFFQPTQIKWVETRFNRASILIESELGYGTLRVQYPSPHPSMIDRVALCKVFDCGRIRWPNEVLFIGNRTVGGHTDKESFNQFINVYDRTYAHQTLETL